MPTLSREQIVQLCDVTIELVAVPEWGGTVGVRVMSGRDLQAFTTAILADTAGQLNQRALVCALTLCDADGARLFQEDDMPLLEAKSSRALERVYEVACRLNVLRDSDREAAKKNASATPDDASGSPLPASLEAAPLPSGKP